MSSPFQYPLPKIARKRVIRLEKEISNLRIQGNQEMPPHNSEATHYHDSPSRHHSTLTLFFLEVILYQPETFPNIFSMVLPLYVKQSLTRFCGGWEGKTRQCIPSLTNENNTFKNSGTYWGFLASLARVGHYWPIYFFKSFLVIAATIHKRRLSLTTP